jgi:hypothetical protein
VATEERDTHAWNATRQWVESHLESGERITDVAWFDGGLTAHVRRISVTGPDGDRDLVLRSFTSDRFLDRATELLTQEARMLRLLDDAGELRWVTLAWNRLGRTDLTLDVMAARLEDYVTAVLDATE